MAKTYQIHPKIGVARLGNSLDEFYIGPEQTGGLPIDCDRNGNVLIEGGRPRHVRRFKDAAGAVKRQAARFRIFEHGESGAREVTIGQSGIQAIQGISKPIQMETSCQEGKKSDR